jgi:hypothetical protein
LYPKAICVVVIPISLSIFAIPSCPPTKYTLDENNILPFGFRLCPLYVRWSAVLSFNPPVHTLRKWAWCRHAIGRLVHKTSWWGCVLYPLGPPTENTKLC